MMMQTPANPSSRDIDSAVLTLQNAWRSKFRFRTTTKVVNRFLKAGLSMEQMKSLNFEQTKDLVSNDSANWTARAFLRRIHMVAGSRHGFSAQCARPSQVDSNMVLCGYFAIFHHARIFQNLGPLESALLESSKRLLERLDVVLKRLRDGGVQRLPLDLTQDLSALFRQFTETYRTWQSERVSSRQARLQSALARLYQARADLPAEGSAQESIRRQITQKRAEIQQLCGDAALIDFEQRFRNGEFKDIGLQPSDEDYDQLTHDLLFDPGYQLNNPNNNAYLAQTNARLRSTSAAVTIFGVDYERCRFNALVKNGAIPMTRITAAISAAISEATQLGDVTQQQLADGASGAYETVHSQMIQLLALGDARVLVTKSTLPETLRFDVLRLNRMRADFLDLTTRAVMLTTVKSAFRSTPACAVFAALRAYLCTRGEGVASHVELVLADMERMTDGLQPLETRTTLLANLRVCVNPDDAVHKLTRNCLADLVSQIISENGGPLTVVRALVELVPRVQAFSNRLLALVRLNRAVHMPTYNRLIEEIVKANERAAKEKAERVLAEQQRAAHQDETQQILDEWKAEAREVALMKKIQAKQDSRKRK